LSGAEVEQVYLDLAHDVKHSVKIPVAIKLNHFLSSIPYVASRLDQIGIDGLSLFNRFYQPDIDLESLEVRPNVVLSDSHELRLPLRWIAILHGRVPVSLAATGGVHTHEDVLKMLMAGANVTMMAAALLRNGVGHIRRVEADLRAWMEAHEYESVRQMQGSLSQFHCPDPSAFERANYIGALHSYRP